MNDPVIKDDLTEAQNMMVGVAQMAAETVTKVTGRLFVPNWGVATLRRLRRNNERVKLLQGKRDE